MKVGASWKMALKWRLMHNRSFPGRVFQSICLFAWARCYILPISNTVSSFAWPGHGSCCWSLWRFSRYPHKRPLLSTSAMPVSRGMQVDPNLLSQTIHNACFKPVQLYTHHTHHIPITYPYHHMPYSRNRTQSFAVAFCMPSTRFSSWTSTGSRLTARATCSGATPDVVGGSQVQLMPIPLRFWKCVLKWRPTPNLRSLTKFMDFFRMVRC